MQKKKKSDKKKMLHAHTFFFFLIYFTHTPYNYMFTNNTHLEFQKETHIKYL